MLKVGDKVLYVGKVSPNIYIQTNQLYTIKEINGRYTTWARVSEITKPHSYDIRDFILATELIVVLS